MDNWILFAKRVHPMIHVAIRTVAREEKLAPRQSHEIITTQQAVHLVSEGAGVAILPKPMAVGVQGEGVVVKPLSDRALFFETSLITRTDDSSRLTNEFARSFLRKFTAPVLPFLRNWNFLCRLAIRAWHDAFFLDPKRPQH
jgi:DNA-binding transcriptional LysR family regulator